MAKPLAWLALSVDMISRRAGGALLIILLLVLSLSLKVLQSHDESAAGDVVEGVSTFLARNGFAIERHAPDEDLFLVSATASECRLLVAILSPEGWHRDVIRKLTPSDSQLIFVYNGHDLCGSAGDAHSAQRLGSLPMVGSAFFSSLRCGLSTASQGVCHHKKEPPFRPRLEGGSTGDALTATD